jgi:hypothetical protein
MARKAEPCAAVEVNGVDHVNAMDEVDSSMNTCGKRCRRHFLTFGW